MTTDKKPLTTEDLWSEEDKILLESMQGGPKKETGIYGMSEEEMLELLDVWG